MSKVAALPISPAQVHAFDLEKAIEDVAKILVVEALDPDTPTEIKVDIFQKLITMQEKKSKQKPTAAVQGSAFDGYRKQSS